jgi:hypothetical protein
VRAIDFLLAAQDLLATGNDTEPRQANLRRASSSVYYALFHTLCETCANMLIRPEDETNRAWTHVYRAIEHGKAKNSCLDKKMIGEFPDEVRDFANTFVAMQEKRHDADYDPGLLLVRSEVETDIQSAGAAIAAFNAAPEKHRRAFAAFILLGKPRS